MATKQAIKTVHTCDVCLVESEYGHESCFSCGVEHCWECRKKYGVGYKHAVGCSGSGDGYYCNLCEVKPEVQINALHKAYVTIRQLRDEYRRFHADFSIREKAAESALAKLPRPARIP